MELTDDSDFHFLYVLDIGESDFHILKKEQSILVDFSVFSDHLIQLFQSINQQIPSKSSSAFTIQLNTIEDKFSIIESNVFKQITHISLKVLLFLNHQFVWKSFWFIVAQRK